MTNPKGERKAASGRQVVAMSLALLPLAFSPKSRAQTNEPPADRPLPEQGQVSPQSPPWQYGGFVDLGYLLDFNHPANHLFRDRGTTPRVNELDLNMAAAYVKKDVSEQSRWGMEFAVQGGEDSGTFGFSATAPNVYGADVLRHFGSGNVKYLAPVGRGFAIQAGLFNSLIGYDSLYARDNFSYTRPWGADYTPYLMFGVNAGYPFSNKISGTLFVVNGYWHLAHANNVPSSGGQLAYKPNERWSLKETALYGPHQANTALEYWRFLSDTIAERKTGRLTAAGEFQVSSETVAAPGNPRALWTAAQLPVHWAIHGPWSLTVRPEYCRDRDGRWTGHVQLVKAVTSTAEYRFSHRRTQAIFRLEYRYDNSTGRDGGFFHGGYVQPGVVGLTPSQHLLIFAAIFTFDSPAH